MSMGEYPGCVRRAPRPFVNIGPRPPRAAARPARLGLERLESRELLAVPRILTVTPPNLSSTTLTQPPISVQFSTNVTAAEATNPANYLLFDSSGNAVPVTTVTY